MRPGAAGPVTRHLGPVIAGDPASCATGVAAGLDLGLVGARRLGFLPFLRRGVVSLGPFMRSQM
jgi:hypothetical protein